MNSSNYLFDLSNIEDSCIILPFVTYPTLADYIKGNLIMQYLKGSCSENVDANNLIYFICKKDYINLSYTYLQFFINRKMFYLLGNDLFKTINYA